MSLSSNKRAILAKIESTYATEAAPTSTDAILCSNLNFTPIDGKTIDRDFIRPFLGTAGSLRVESFGKLSFNTELAGAGAGATLSQWGALLPAANFATTSVSSSSGTCQAGSSSTTIKLAAVASSNDDVYVGAQVNTTGGTGNGQSGEIVAYNGTTKVATVRTAWATTPDATTTYTIPAFVYALPTSVFGAANNSSLTIYFNVDGVRHILLGCRANFGIDIASGAIPSIKWDLIGLLGTISDQALPTTDYTGWKTPVPALTANTSNLTVMGYDTSLMESLSIDIGNTISHRALIGREDILISNRKVTAKMKIEATTLAQKNFFSALQANSFGDFYIKHGTAAGNTVCLMSPRQQLSSVNYSDSNGVQMLDIDSMLCTGSTVGNDEIRIVTR